MKFLLKKLAELTIWKFGPKIVGVTGSAGKTSTLEGIYTILARSASHTYKKIRISQGDLVSDLLIPLTILVDPKERELRLLEKKELNVSDKIKRFILWMKIIGLGISQLIIPKKNYPNILLLEYSSRKPDEIKNLLEIGRPYIGIVTALGEIPAHVEFWSGPDAISREKSKLIEYLPSHGYAVLNFDDEAVLSMRERTRARVITFGFGEGADIRITNFQNRSDGDMPLGISFKLNYGGSTIPLVIKNIFGRAGAYLAAAAASVGLIFDLNLVEISEALSSNWNLPSDLKLTRGIKNTYIIDGTYNASPASVHEALHTLEDLPGSRKIAVLGDILELGKYAIEAHEAIGRLTAQFVNMLVTVGPRAKFIAEAARKAGLAKNKILSYDSATEACRPIQNIIKSGDLILIKGSKEMGLGRVVEEIKVLT